MSQSNEVELFTVAEAASFLAIKESRVRTAVFKKELPFVKIGRLVRFRKVELVHWIESRTVAASETGAKCP